MKRRRRRFSWTRVTRDPAVAAAYEHSAEASDDWTLALGEALRAQADDPTAEPLAFPPPAPRQLALPLEDAPAPAAEPAA